MQSQGNNVRNIVADRRSVAAGRDIHMGDYNVTVSLCDLKVLLASRADDPNALKCAWCGLRGQPPSRMECMACGEEIGAERRAREAAQAQHTRKLQRLGTIRFAVCYTLALVIVAALIKWRLAGESGMLGMLFCGVVLTGCLGELLIHAAISVEVWFVFDVWQPFCRRMQRYTER